LRKDFSTTGRTLGFRFFMNDETIDERRARALATWERLSSARTSKETIHGTVLRTVKGGALLDIDGYRAFLPASQTRVPKGETLETLVKTTLPLKVIDVDEKQKRLIVSHRQALQEERRAARAALLQSLTVGEEREATVARLADFGAFVDLGGVDALIPLSELDINRVEKPGDVVHVGDRIKVRVLRVDAGGKKVAVSRKALLPDPWRDHAQLLRQGKVVEGRVVGNGERLEVEVAPGIVGSVSDREATPADYEIGEAIDVMIRSVDSRARRLRLSIPQEATSYSSSFAPLGVELRR
jgi:small subunit ribosomal protein S1